jgi:hypothetical protein
MMNASVYIELSCEFGTSLFTLHCPQFRSTLEIFLCVDITETLLKVALNTITLTPVFF